MHNTNRLKRGICALLAMLLLNSPLVHSVVIGVQPDNAFASKGESLAIYLVVIDLGNYSPSPVIALGDISETSATGRNVSFRKWTDLSHILSRCTQKN
jgi:hypothetical protein